MSMGSRFRAAPHRLARQGVQPPAWVAYQDPGPFAFRPRSAPMLLFLPYLCGKERAVGNGHNSETEIKMAPIKFRRRSKRASQGRRCADSRQGPLYRRLRAAAVAACAGAALAACPCEIHHQCHAAPAACPASPLILTAEDVKDLGDLPCLFNLEDPFTGPPYPILAEGRSPPCRRRRGVRGRRHHRSARAMRSRRSRSNGRRCRPWSACAMR